MMVRGLIGRMSRGCAVPNQTAQDLERRSRLRIYSVWRRRAVDAIPVSQPKLDRLQIASAEKQGYRPNARPFCM